MGEILELQQGLREGALHALDEDIEEIVVILAGHALVAPADIHRILEALLVVGADVEQDRQRCLGADAAAGGVERQLADRDPHAAGALVAEAEDPLAVGHHDRLDLGERRVAQDRVDAVAFRIGNEEAPVVPIDLAELLARGTDHRGVDHR